MAEGGPHLTVLEKGHLQHTAFHRLGFTFDYRVNNRVASEARTLHGETVPQARFSRIGRMYGRIGATVRVYALVKSIRQCGTMSALDELTTTIGLIYTPTTRLPQQHRKLAKAIQDHGIPRELFEQLAAAVRSSLTKPRYQTYTELLSHCASAANPLGRIALYLSGCMTEHRAILSDRVCSAMMLLDHCVSLPLDMHKGLLYLPLDDLTRFGLTEQDLRTNKPQRRIRALLAFHVQRALRLLDSGGSIIGALHGPSKIIAACYVARGRALASALARAGFAVAIKPIRIRRRRWIGEWVVALIVGGGR